MSWFKLWLLKNDLKAPGAFYRAKAAEALAYMRGDKAIELLIYALGDPSWPVRLEAIKGLENIGDKRAIEPMVVTLADYHPKVRKESANALDKLGYKPPDKTHEALMLIAYGKWDDVVQLGEAAVEALMNRVKDNDADTLSRTIMALGKLSAKKALQPIISALKNENDEHVRSTAAEALGKIRDSQATEPLMAALSDSSHFVRRDAARALVEIGDVRGIESLVPLLKDSDRSVREIAAQALEEAESPETQRALSEYRAREQKLRKAEEFAEQELREVNAKTLTSALTLGIRLKGPPTDKTNHGRKGTCRTCGKVWLLSNAKVVCLDWDGVNAYHYYCPNCFKGTADPFYYTGQLNGADGDAVIDQHAWYYEG